MSENKIAQQELHGHEPKEAISDQPPSVDNHQPDGATNGNSEKNEEKPKDEKKDEKDEKKDKQPEGGFDKTRLPRIPPGYTLKITFHRATNLPMADINSLSSDPFILAQISTSLPVRHKEDPPLMFRTPTIRKNTNPEWNTEWIVANVPSSGFRLKCRLYDEDPADHDDRLGNVTIYVNHVDESWQGINDQTYPIKKRMGSKRAYMMRAMAVCLHKTKHMDGHLAISIENLGRTKDSGGARCYTLGPMWWTRHYSPMLGRLAGRKESSDENCDTKSNKKAEAYNFQANQFQLSGPTPPELYHRYVEFKPFVKLMFTSSGISGWILSKGLHHQHARVYNFDSTTEYGTFPKPSKESTLKFLDLVHFDKGGRIFTYVLTLDSLFRFTETGKEFGIDFLSKHTMHSDVSIYIAFSGEFFVRRLKHKDRTSPDEIGESQESTNNESHPPNAIGNGPPEADGPQDPGYYELVIDNDSGTYRPNADLLPVLKQFLEYNLPGLHIITLDCQKDADRQQRMKKEQRERKEKEGDRVIYRQHSRGSSISSSDISDLDAMEQAAGQDKQPSKKSAGKDLVGAIGRDYKQRGSSKKNHWKGLVKGRDGGQNADAVNGESNGVEHTNGTTAHTNGESSKVEGETSSAQPAASTSAPVS